MPEGPSIVILKELVQEFKAKKIVAVTGNSKQDIQRIAGQKLVDIKSWGKHFLLCFKKFTVRIHFMLFGSYSINEKIQTKKTRLGLHFKNGDLFFYACSVNFLEEDADEIYDWTGDVMNENWDPAKARKKLKQLPGTLVCDALLDQHIFAGVGNIIKNEVCFRIYLHPESNIGALPLKKLNELIRESKNYSFEFLEWKKAYVLRKHWLAYTKKICPRCEIPMVKKYSGRTRRRTFFCTSCQVLFYNLPGNFEEKLPRTAIVKLKKRKNPLKDQKKIR
ncbi:MAG: DNA-formamidopyrimidine glycosylase family protein [Ginsengibacter sp.]